MKKVCRELCLDVIKKTISLLEEDGDKKIYEIKEVSDVAIKNAAVFQNERAVTLAVVIYTIAKLLDRGLDVELAEKLIANLKNMEKLLELKQTPEYKKSVDSLLRKISSHDKRLRKYIETIIEKAHIKKSSNMHEHGISLARSADLLDITQWDLMEYIGKTDLPDIHPPRKDALARLAYARRLFK